MAREAEGGEIQIGVLTIKEANKAIPDAALRPDPEDRFILMCADFLQKPYKVDSELNVIEG